MAIIPSYGRNYCEQRRFIGLYSLPLLTFIFRSSIFFFFKILSPLQLTADTSNPDCSSQLTFKTVYLSNTWNHNRVTITCLINTKLIAYKLHTVDKTTCNKHEVTVWNFLLTRKAHKRINTSANWQTSPSWWCRSSLHPGSDFRIGQRSTTSLKQLISHSCTKKQCILQHRHSSSKLNLQHHDLLIWN